MLQFCSSTPVNGSSVIASVPVCLTDNIIRISQQEECKMDRISNLPIGIIETILCLLPIQEAARTSILSKEWRYHWIKIPKLEFSEDSFQVSTDGAELSILEQTFGILSKRKEMAKRCRLFYAIYQVLLMHQGPIHQFTLRMEVDRSCVEIDHIILHLSKKNTVKILNLDFNGGYRLPLSLSSFHQLTELHLHGCYLNHQPFSSGFACLTTLYFQEIYTSEKVLLRLFLGCPSLKRLTINGDSLNIISSGDSTMADFVECLPGIKYLSVWFYFYLCFLPDTPPRELPEELPVSFVHLKHLCVEYVSFDHASSLPFLVLLIQSSPHLEKLRIGCLDDGLVEEERGSFTPEDYSDIMLEHLNELEILEFSNKDNELVFVELMLAKSPVLKNVRITIRDDFDEEDVLETSEMVLSFPCASPLVNIIVS